MARSTRTHLHRDRVACLSHEDRRRLIEAPFPTFTVVPGMLSRGMTMGGLIPVNGRQVPRCYESTDDGIGSHGYPNEDWDGEIEQ
jgi:hypothetical protein